MFGLRILRPYTTLNSLPVELEESVSVAFQPLQRLSSLPLKTFKQTARIGSITVRGKLGQLSFPLHRGLLLEQSRADSDGGSLFSVVKDKQLYSSLNKHQREFISAMHGTTRAILRRHIEGVTELQLRIVGVGYRANLEDGRLVLRLGYSHDVVLPIPRGVNASLPMPTKVVLRGIDWHRVTQFAALIRSKRKPEPYNCKGIFVGDETIVKKEGKKK